MPSHRLLARSLGVMRQLVFRNLDIKTCEHEGDPELKNETYEINAKTDKILSRPLMEFFRDSWLGSTGVAHNDPRVNLLHSDLAGLPPINIHYGTHELLVGENLEFADRARAASVDVTQHSVPEGSISSCSELAGSLRRTLRLPRWGAGFGRSSLLSTNTLKALARQTSLSASHGHRSSDAAPWAASAFTALFSDRIHSASPTDWARSLAPIMAANRTLASRSDDAPFAARDLAM